MYLIIIQIWAALSGILRNITGTWALYLLLIVFGLWCEKNRKGLSHFIRHPTRIDFLILVMVLHNLLYFMLAKMNWLGVAENHADWFGTITGVLPYLAFIVVRTTPPSKTGYQNLIWTGTLSVASILGLCTLASLFAGGSFAEYGAGSELMGINPNNFGSMYVGIFAITLPFLGRRISFLWLSTIICLSSVANSRSLTAIVTIIGIYGIYLITKRAYSILVPLVVIGVVFFAGWTFVGELLPRYGFGQDLLWAQKQIESGDYNALVTGRFILWQAAQHYLSEASPFQWIFGSGLGGFASSLHQYLNIDLDVHPHNHLLQRLLDGGLISLSLYLSLMCLMLLDSLHEYTRNKTSLPLGVFLMVFSYLIMDLAGPRFAGRALFFTLPPIALFYNVYKPLIRNKSSRRIRGGKKTMPQPNPCKVHYAQ